MTVFPLGKHDDEVDSTAEFSRWVQEVVPRPGHLLRTESCAHRGASNSAGSSAPERTQRPRRLVTRGGLLEPS
jgi:hypothetical protein